MPANSPLAPPKESESPSPRWMGSEWRELRAWPFAISSSGDGVSPLLGRDAAALDDWCYPGNNQVILGISVRKRMAATERISHSPLIHIGEEGSPMLDDAHSYRLASREYQAPRRYENKEPIRHPFSLTANFCPPFRLRLQISTAANTISPTAIPKGCQIVAGG